MSLSIQGGAFPKSRARAPVTLVFPRLAKLLHWLTAALVLALFCAGVVMKQLGEGPGADALYTFHKTAGITLLVVVVVRLCFRLAARVAGRWPRGAGSRPVHGLLYGLLILVPLLGWAGVSDFGARQLYIGLSLPMIWAEGAGYADLLFKGHAVLAFGLIGLVAVHIGLAVGDYIQHGNAGRTEMPHEGPPSHR
ncbi:cytochrome b/b6 domain-containing protein [Bosea sp. BK604]|uniref:cytochrome b n=1 Tax=Bosea sp. BK604 TaxID=2512180 RepID=UPI00104BA6ED|nr:cytochrome b/b6 domain-containing protein [Bosea sp. BK604]TCR59357.1 cytochrome b561 [Bosea sp. BK604]